MPEVEYVYARLGRTRYNSIEAAYTYYSYRPQPQTEHVRARVLPL